MLKANGKDVEDKISGQLPIFCMPEKYTDLQGLQEKKAAPNSFT